MSHEGDHEPLFVRRRRGGIHGHGHVFNHRNPVGLALIVLFYAALLIAAVVILA